MAKTHKVKGQIATDEMFLPLFTIFLKFTHIHTHTSSNRHKQRVDERAHGLVGGWGMKREEGKDGRMGG